MARKQVNFSINPLFSGPSLDQRIRSGSPYRELSIDDIDVDPDQPRRFFEDSLLSELADSIKTHGVLCPILVRPIEGGTFRIVAGERRFRASKIAGLKTIPAVIDNNDGGDGNILPKQLVENLQRADLSCLERAIAIGHLKEARNWSIREIASNLGISKGMVQRSLEVLALPDDLKIALEDGKPETKVLLLAQVDDRDLRKELLARLDDLTRDELETEIKEGVSGIQISTEPGAYHGGTKRGVSARQTQLDPDDQRIVNDLQKSLGTKVDLVRKKADRRRGKIQIDFYSEDDLKTIFSRLVV